MKKRYLFIVLIILCIASIFIGVTNININDILTFNIDKIEILLISRLPRLIAIIVAGVGLSISGLIMQQISKNKFVSPTTAATADFAKLGILFCIMIIPGATIMQKMIVSFVFAGLGTVLFMKMIKAIKIKNIVFVPLIGMMLGKIVGSITTFFAYKYDLVQNISSWMEGDMSLIMKGSYELLYLSVPMVIIAFLYANKFTIVGMGEDFAINLGLNYNFVINVGLAIVSLICAVTIITVGNIPFLGLIIPNIVSLYSGDNLKKTLYHTALLGPIFLLACDILGRIIIFPFEMSISLTVGVIGSIIFLYMIVRGTKMKTKDKKSIIILTVLALILITSFLFIGVNSVNFKYALYRRIPKIYAMILTGAAIGFSSLIFQTVTNNRILTPSILGIDSLYVLLQTTIVFLLGSSSAIISNGNINFIITIVSMLLFSSLIY